MTDRYGWSGWFEGEGDCEPPEPGKRWLEIHTLEANTEGDEIAIIVQRGRRRVTPCTCGVKSIQRMAHEPGCLYRESSTTPVFDFDREEAEKREERAQLIVNALNAYREEQ